MKTSLAVVALTLTVVASSLIGYIVYSESKKSGAEESLRAIQTAPGDSTAKLPGGKLFGNLDFQKCSPIEMFGTNSIPLGGENYFALEIGANNSIAGSFHIGGGGETVQKADTEKTYTSYSAYYEGQVDGTWDPASSSGQGSVTLNMKMDLSNGQTSSSPVCPNANLKSPETCKFVLTKDGNGAKLTVKYGAKPDGTPFEFTVE